MRLGHPVVVRAAAEVGAAPRQDLLAWGLRKGLVVLPKSTRPERLAENFEACRFALPHATVAALDALEEGLVTGWDPRRAP